MKKIYLVDLGLLVAAGTLAFVLITKPAASEPNDGQEEAVATAVSKASATTPKEREFSAE